MSKFDIHTPAAQAQMAAARQQEANAIVQALFARDLAREQSLRQHAHSLIAMVLTAGGTVRVTPEAMDLAQKHQVRVELDEGTQEQVWTAVPAEEKHE